MKIFKQVTIIGVGLIGGSLGLALRRKGLAGKVIGVGHHRRSIKCAIRIRAIDEGTLNVFHGIKGSDLVVLATPISDIVKIAKKIRKYLAPATILTDVGSTKKYIVREVEKNLAKGVHFVGSHPMAGSEKRGVNFADANLFKDTLTFLTKTAKTDRKVLGQVARMWKAVGAKVKVISPDEHDRIVAQISHLVHLAACGLVKTCKGQMTYASSGFKGTTRVAGGDPALWLDICLTNKSEILKSLGRYEKEINRTKRLIAKGSAKQISAKLKEAKLLRDRLDER